MGLSGQVPQRVDAAAKAGLIGLVDGAVRSGWSDAQACRYLELSQRRLQRWRCRVAAGVGLDDEPPGGSALHALTPQEAEEIVAVFDEWAEVDRSHRKLAHRGSWLDRFWADGQFHRSVHGAGHDDRCQYKHRPMEVPACQAHRWRCTSARRFPGR